MNGVISPTYSMSSNQEYKEIVDTMVGVCLGFLVKIGFVEYDKINGKWCTRCDMDTRLNDLGFFAAASIDNLDRPVMIYHSKHPIKAVAHFIPHESVHLAQICKGDWEPFKGHSLWKGKRYPNLQSTDPNYFSQEHQPWEAEAKELEDQIKESLHEKFPMLKCL